MRFATHVIKGSQQVTRKRFCLIIFVIVVRGRDCGLSVAPQLFNLCCNDRIVSLGMLARA